MSDGGVEVVVCKLVCSMGESCLEEPLNPPELSLERRGSTRKSCPLDMNQDLNEDVHSKENVDLTWLAESQSKASDTDSS